MELNWFMTWLIGCAKFLDNCKKDTMVPIDKVIVPLIVNTVPIKAIQTYCRLAKLLAIGIKILINL